MSSGRIALREDATFWASDRWQRQTGWPQCRRHADRLGTRPLGLQAGFRSVLFFDYKRPLLRGNAMPARSVWEDLGDDWIAVGGGLWRAVECARAELDEDDLPALADSGARTHARE